MWMNSYGLYASGLGGLGATMDQWQWQPNVVPTTPLHPDSSAMTIETREVEVNYRGSNTTAGPHGRRGNRSTFFRR